MTKKTLAELRAETDQLMHRPLHMDHETRIAALAADRNAADFEIERLTRERDGARAEVERLRAEVEKLRALPSAEDLEERAHEILDGAGIPTHALDPVSGEEDYRAGLEERLEWTVEEITRARADAARLRGALEGEAKRCAWTYDETHFAWDSSCGKKWILMDGGPSENEIRFCHGCGKPVEVACEVTPEKARQGEKR